MKKAWPFSQFDITQMDTLSVDGREVQVSATRQPYYTGTPLSFLWLKRRWLAIMLLERLMASPCREHASFLRKWLKPICWKCSTTDVSQAWNDIKSKNGHKLLQSMPGKSPQVLYLRGTSQKWLLTCAGIFFTLAACVCVSVSVCFKRFWGICVSVYFNRMWVLKLNVRIMSYSDVP